MKVCATTQSQPIATHKPRSPVPCFRLSMGYTLTYMALLIFIPVSMLFFHATHIPIQTFWEAVSHPRALAAYRLSFFAAFLAALVNCVFGTITAWVLTRYSFWGRRLIDALVDLPFAVPTAVAGIALTAVWSSTSFPGSLLATWGIKTAYSQVGVFIAMLFVGLPFVVRNVQPVVESLDVRLEEAAQTLGAGPVTIFFKVTIYSLIPALITGFSLSFARALGEYGSIVFISGNLPFKTEIAPLLIMTKLEQFDYNGAVAIAIVMLAASFTILFLVNGLHWRAANNNTRRPSKQTARTESSS